MRTVMIGGSEYKLAYNLRTLFIFEELSGHPYKGKRTVETYMLMYACLMANNTEFSMEFDAFIDACDADMGLFTTFTEVLSDQGRRTSAFLENKKKAMTQ